MCTEILEQVTDTSLLGRLQMRGIFKLGETLEQHGHNMIAAVIKTNGVTFEITNTATPDFIKNLIEAFNLPFISCS